jgi:hypothetical protein
MRSVAWRARFAGLALVITINGGCDRPRGEQVRVIDLMERLSTAETRPVDGPFEIREVTCGNVPRPSLAVPPSSRAIWSTFLPSRAVLTSGLAVEGPPGAAVLFRVGISDDRVYEGLTSMTVRADDCGNGWTPLSVDLEDYSGVKFSLFYQPNQRTWRIVLATNVQEGAVVRAYWAQPGISSDTSAAHDYVNRIRRRGLRR